MLKGEKRPIRASWGGGDGYGDNFSSLGDIIDQTLLNNPRYDFAMKCSTLFGFWGQIVGSKFEKFSKPVNLAGGKLSVVCKSPVVVQELTMFKAELLEKTAKFATPLGLQVTDFIFSYKNWESGSD